jgi:hypothetical protein
MDSLGVSTTCSATKRAVAHGIADISITPPGTRHPVRLIIGVAPNRAKEAVVHTHDITSAIPVHHEVFVLRDSILAPPDSISLR